jgi:hypothetical protein
MSVDLRRRALVFWKYSARSKAGTFGRLLGLHPREDGGLLDIREITSDRSVIATVIRPWCCRSDGRLCLSAAVALFDEISTYGGTVVWDRSARPGVSIQLAARANSVLDVGSGDTVVVTTHLQKLVGR